jgi:3-dehydroquinate synthase
MQASSKTSTRTLTVELGPRSYPIYVGAGLLERGELLGRHLAGRRAFILSNRTVGPLYLERLQKALGASRAESLELPEGEVHKNMSTVGAVLDALVGHRYARDAVLIALGGGVVGDIGGFVAAIYQRGIDFIQVPTTLLAQVDSAVGGKTGVNHPGGKNLIGAFHQPICVLADSSTLATLPDRELSAGLAEVVKYGLLADAELFGWLEQHAADLLRRDPAALNHVIGRSCEIKAAFVAGDEREQGRRALLNLGHTFGHAIERCQGYGDWLHGEAVAAGMVMAAKFSSRLGWLPVQEVARIEQLIAACRLPVRPPALPAAEFLAAMAMDKKVLAGQIRLVLPRAIGTAEVTAGYPLAELQAFLREQLKGP